MADFRVFMDGERGLIVGDFRELRFYGPFCFVLSEQEFRYRLIGNFI